MQILCICHGRAAWEDFQTSFLPSVLSEELLLKLFQILAESLLLFTGLLELLHQFLPVRRRKKNIKSVSRI